MFGNEMEKRTAKNMSSYVLLKDICNSPRSLSSSRRLERRSLQLFQLAKDLEEYLDSGDMSELLIVCPRAIECIAVDIKLVADRLEMQGRNG